MNDSKDKVAPVNALKAYRGRRSMAVPVINLSTRWRWGVSFTLRPLYPSGKNHGNYWTVGWVGPRAGPELSEKW
jgi:hypothetical protein